MFVYIGGNREKPSIIYDYQPTRSGQSTEILLKGFEGYLQTDAFAGYNIFNKNNKITSVGCWAHARRKFFDIVKITKQEGKAHEIIKKIKKLYKIEKYARINKLSPEKRKTLRDKKSKPMLDKIKKWLEKNYVKTAPKSMLGKAMAYTLNNWQSLTKYLDNGILEIDNNLAENAIRPFALGRKNWLFSNNERGAKASAIIYSLIETCRKNDIESYAYMKNILIKLPYCKTTDDYEKLLPQNYNLQLQAKKDPPD